MATTTEAATDRVSQPKIEPARGALFNGIAIALGVGAALCGLAYAIWGVFPAPLPWVLQAKTAIWGVPVIAAGGAALARNYPRTGAVLLAVAAVVGIILLAYGGGAIPPTLVGAVVLAAAAGTVSLASIVAAGDSIRATHIRNGVVVRPDWLTRFAAAKIASAPMFLVVLGVFIGGTIWTIVYSFTRSASLPATNFIGFAQYERLFNTVRWQISVKNLAVYGVFMLAFSFVVGFLLAVFMDQKIRFESAFRTIYLYPFALSFIVTGHVWAWIMNPAFGLQKALRDIGWTSFTFDWLGNRDMVVYTLVIAGLWQGTGLIMALMLAGLRGIDEEVWRAARVDGIPKWRTYISIVIPMMRPVLITTLVISASGIVRIYDLVVALTQGGPGLFSEMPAKYVYDNMFQGALGQGLAASSVMLVVTGIILIPWAIVEFGGRRRQ